MALFTFEQVRKLCVDVADFTPDEAKIAAAISSVESADFDTRLCDSNKVGDIELQDATWGPSVGLFQIRSLKNPPEGSWRVYRMLFDPMFNCQAARAIYLDQGWNAWSVYRDGKYKAYLPDEFPPQPGTYIVVSGDTFLGIDKKVGLEPGTVQKLNPGLDPRKLQIGQVLNLPFSNYTVKPGDSLSLIAFKHGGETTWQEIAAYNRLENPHLIYPGQLIKIPRKVLL